MSATTRKKRTPRSKRKPRGFFQAEGMTDLVIPMALEDRLALRYLQLRTGQPTPQKTVMGLIKSMIMAMRLEDELKAKEAENAEENPQYANTAGEAVDPGTFAAPPAADAVLVGEVGDIFPGDTDANLCDDGSRADGN